MISGGIDFIFRVFGGKLPTKIKVLILKLDISLKAIYCHIVDWWYPPTHNSGIKINIDFNAMRCAIWYDLHNLKNVKNSYGGRSDTFSSCRLKVTFLHGCFSHI